MNPEAEVDFEPVEEPPRRSGARQLTRREQRRRIILLVALLLILALLGFLTYYFVQNRRLPSFNIPVSRAELIPPPEYLYSITGSGASQLERPVGVAWNRDRVYVVDFGKHTVAVFTENGRYLFSFKNIDKGKTLSRPNIVAIRSREVWVTDRLRRDVFIFDLNGKFLRRFEPKGEKLKWAPFALGFGPDGEFVISDVRATEKHRLHFFSAEGSRTATVGKTAEATALEDEPGGFLFPSSVSIASDGRVYVSDGDNRRMQVFKPDTSFSAFIDTSGIPRGSAIDARKRLYVADALAHTVDVYDLEGKRLTQFGGQGFGPGQFNYPGYIAVNNRGKIFVTDRENNQVQVWGWPQDVPGAAALPKTPLGWTACLAPLLLLPLLLLLRKRRVVVTSDFVDALVAASEVAAVSKRARLRLICPEDEHALYEGRVVDGIDLGELITGEPHSESDVSALMERLEITERQAILVAMAEREKALATEDGELRRVAVLADVRVVDLDDFREEFLRK